jgi:hypothetical protein
MTDTTKFARAVRAFRDTVAQARSLRDDTLSDHELLNRRREIVDGARVALLGQRPSLPTIPTRDGVLESLRASSADEYAALRHEQEKITRLLEAGQQIGDVLRSADVGRALAVADMADTLPSVLESGAPAEVAAEYRAAAYDRLGELGVEAVTKQRALELEWAAPLAWDRVITEQAAGPVSIGAWQNVHVVDRDGYEAAGGAGDPTDAWLARLT